MSAHADKTQENKSQSGADAVSQKRDSEPAFQFFDNRPEAIAQRKLKEIANDSSQVKQSGTIQEMADNRAKENNTGLPDNLKSGIENLSGYSMDGVKVHYNSDKPAQMQAHAYTQGTNIHIAFGQEKHLPHEAWHVVQQKQGRVNPTMQLKDKDVSINDDAILESEADVMGAKALQMSHREQAATRPTSLQRSGLTIQKRAADPYDRGAGDSPQVHHIISHSKLIGALAHLAAGDQDEVKREYMPSIAKITVRQLYKIADRLVFTNSTDPHSVKTLSRTQEYFDPWTESGLTELDENAVTISGAFGFNHSLRDFKTAYEAERTGNPSAAGSAEFWTALKDSYFEWSGGNLFYGEMSRAEPGGTDLDKFDSDAIYFRDKAHVQSLKQKADELEGLVNVDQAQISQPNIKSKLIAIGQQNRDLGAGPVNDRSKWVKPKTAKQKNLVLSLLPDGPRKDYIESQGAQKALPVGLISPKISTFIEKKLENDLESSLTNWFKNNQSAQRTYLDSPYDVTLKHDAGKQRVSLTYEGATITPDVKIHNNIAARKVKEVLREIPTLMILSMRVDKA